MGGNKFLFLIYDPEKIKIHKKKWEDSLGKELQLLEITEDRISA